MVITNEDDTELRDTVYLAAFLAVSGVALYKAGRFMGRVAERREMRMEQNRKNAN